ncbi:ATP-dependent helicase [Psychromonas antarctica]|uniref:ATP-dependent helicase n=1 Tax=Psychromonas antarctica TaxID=67573 RepID=UPI001EE86DF7|nr:ATP-dependent helicase [Psychromonas antarctica]MCG6200037.1 ATP-dependent helicase [Psychromonas antarctica]
MINLSETQTKIVRAPIGTPIQILASAGSGKTRVLTERIRFILDNTKKDRVIALTFTNKAAEEMQERLVDVDEVEDRTWISTVHSIAQRILEQYGHTIGLPSELHIYDRDKDRMEVFLQSLRDEGVDIDEYLNIEDSKEKKNRQQVMQNYMDTFSVIKRELLSQEEVEDRFSIESGIWKIYQDYQSALLASGGIDYDDILIFAHKLLLTQEWIADLYRTKFKHICVDEAQDLNKAQYEFINAFCGDKVKSILMVGDPNQMIYGFNGSSEKYLTTQFVEDYNPTKYKLTENYRSTKAIIKVANQIKPQSQTEHEMALNGLFHKQECEDEYVEAQWVVNQINELLKLENHGEIEGNITLENMVIIARNRFVFKALTEKLEQEKIAFNFKKGERQAEPTSLFGKILDYSIRLKLNPKDWVDGKKLCALLKIKPPKEWHGDNLLSTWSREVINADILFPSLQAELLANIDSLDSEEPNIPKFYKESSEQLNKLANDAELDDKKPEIERSIKELEEFRSAWTRFKLKGLGESLQAFRNALALGQLAESAQGKGITLSTVHTMKGLEKDIVFLVGMVEGVFPDYRAKTAQDIEEEQNSAFVAVTRARRWLYITYPQRRTMPWGDIKYQSPSRFIKNLKV